MITYLKDSLGKFKKDALSKVLYDTLKYLFLTFFVVFIMKFIPYVKEKLAIQISLSVWAFIIITLTIFLLSFLISNFLFRFKYKQLQDENQTDELTGLKNYKALESDLSKLELEKNSNDEPIALILIDVDDFKKFNEENGYDIADKILKKLGQFLNKDKRITDETYRYFLRGDEFLIIARKTNISNAKIAANRKRELIQEATFTIDQTDYKLTVCCGVTEFNIGESQHLVKEKLNKALLAAKKKPNKNSTEIVL